jgi:DNA-directed RNA polymerase subunit RPC12/RpoP
MGILTKLKKYLRGSGGIKCLDCGNYAEGAGADDWIVQFQSYPECPECGSGKTKQGVFVTKDKTNNK